MADEPKDRAPVARLSVRISKAGVFAKVYDPADRSHFWLLTASESRDLAADLNRIADELDRQIKRKAVVR